MCQVACLLESFAALKASYDHLERNAARGSSLGSDSRATDTVGGPAAAGWAQALGGVMTGRAFQGKRAGSRRDGQQGRK